MFPTIVANKMIFNDLRNKSTWNNVLLIFHGLNLCVLEIMHIAYLFNKRVDIIEFATMEETITSTIEVSLHDPTGNMYKCLLYNLIHYTKLFIYFITHSF